MTRLIDVDKLASDLLEKWHTADKESEKLISAVMADVVAPILVSQPTVDAVPVIRCKDCNLRKYGECVIWKSEMPDDGYCFMGERKEE